MNKITLCMMIFFTLLIGYDVLMVGRNFEKFLLYIVLVSIFGIWDEISELKKKLKEKKIIN